MTTQQKLDANFVNALDRGSIQSALEYAKLGANIDSTNKYKVTLLIYAADQGNIDTLRTVIKMKANLDLQDKWGDTALISAIKKKHSDCALLLIEAGADLFLKDENNKSALNLAENMELIEVKEKILSMISTDGGFVLETDHCVSRTTDYKTSNLTVTQLFDFNTQEILTITKGAQAANTNVRQFAELEDITPIKNAAKALSELGGKPKNWPHLLPAKPEKTVKLVRRHKP